MAFSTKIIRALTYPKYRAFVRACADIENAQARAWEETKKELRNGSFWRGRVAERLEDYPVTDYENYREALTAGYAAKISPLTGREILFWSESSGTTGMAKIYPITNEYKKSFQSTTPPFLHCLARRFRDFLGEPVLYFAATLPKDRSPAGIERGFISGFNYRNIPPLLKTKYAFPLEVFRDRETFFRWGPLYALATDLSAMIAITPSMLEQFALATEENLASYWPFLEGMASEPPAPGLPPVRVKPGRLAAVRAAFRDGAPFSFRVAWPSLQFVCCWKTATCGLQLSRLAPWLRGEVPIVDATYSATEGWITVPLAGDGTGGPFHPGALVTEFFPAGEEPVPENILKPWQLRPGESYEILLTTKMGFVRYRLYDVVRCTGFFERSPILEFAEKAGNTVSIGQTRISETHVLTALGMAGAVLPASWILAPARDGSGLLLCHPAGQKVNAGAVDALDRALQKANPEYYDDISDKLLRPLRAQPTPDDHPLWVSASHAQSKPKVIQQKPVAE